MAINPILVLYGTAGGVAINVDHSRIDSSAPVKVQLSASYTLAPRPPGAPSRPGFTGADAVDLDYPRAISSGVILSVLRAEAVALVAAGKASYV